ncbi:hypothetical protein E4P82_05675 [Candidatus Competibacter phosphatis]|uniref:Uncharacterized protein n=1 Tax=Candidatus Competibacter phosphatis TaxID=221280 RepID=A0ABX1TJ63_9GAMM|nr:hypothetical protein [Candidatus Competibacter phosphatis]
MSGNTISVDPRIVTPLACFPGDLSRYPKDTLHRVAITLDLLSELLGNYNGEATCLDRMTTGLPYPRSYPTWLEYWKHWARFCKSARR